VRPVDPVLPGDDASNLRLVLRGVAAARLHEPEAYFQCNIAVAVAGDPAEVLLAFESRVQGRIVGGARGGEGFGNDPISFRPESGCTFGELDPDRKNLVSHRAVALRELARRLPEVRERSDL